MNTWNRTLPWYHGSPLVLTTLQVGSTITQSRDLARVFSHKPSIVSQDEDAEGNPLIKHTGTQPGFLYRIVEPLQAGDIYPHPETTMGEGQEWLITRALRVELLEPTQLVADEILTQEEITILRTRSNEINRNKAIDD